jgi:hypothetical protein
MEQFAVYDEWVADKEMSIVFGKQVIDTAVNQSLVYIFIHRKIKVIVLWPEILRSCRRAISRHVVAPARIIRTR